MSDSTSPRPAADRNLLFGILALQMDFIGRDALIRGMNAWVLDKAKSLGQILVGQGGLADEAHRLLEALVQKHLEMHGGDPQKSLASIRPLGPVREELRQATDPDVLASLARLPADPYSTGLPARETTPQPGLHFRILRPHARGGLGEVFVARDEELGREVALKEIQAQHADHPESRARFLLEAEITGELEHPGIVPVYGLGTHLNGRPYYAMRFIRGDNLQNAIRRFHEADGAGRAPGARALELRQLLRRFVDVCNAIAYAYSRSVLHRDLKPANILLGPYGETLVVDWGLAKPIGQAEGADVSVRGPLQPASASRSDTTQAGLVLGTPAFMSPEQAAGRLDRLGPAADVYGLGATLYCLLTGKTPFDGEVGSVLQKVQRGDFPPPRRVNGSVPPALEAVCLKAMALRPEDRYLSAQALADEVEHWLADEPVGAYREPWAARAGRWARRHKPAVAAAAAAALAVALLGGVGAWWLAREEGRRRQGVEAALSEVARLQGQSRWAEARAVLNQAEGRLRGGGPAGLRDSLGRARTGLDLVARLDAVRLKRATLVEGKFDTAGADGEYEEAFREAGMDEVGGDEAAAAAWVAGGGAHDALVAALDDWAACARGRPRRDWLLGVARRADPDPWRDGARDPAAWDDVAALTRLAADERAAVQSPHLLAALGTRLAKLGGDARPLLRAAQGRHPGDFWVNFHLGNALLKGDPGEAVGYYRAALALRPGTAAVHSNIGNGLRAWGRPDEAIAEQRKALELDPNLALPHNRLGNALQGKGRRDEAVAEYHKAIELDPKYAAPHLGLGAALKALGRPDEAIAEYHKAIELDPKFAAAHYNLSNALRALGRPDEAIAEYQKAIDLEPHNGLRHAGLGRALLPQGRFAEARQSIQRSLQLLPPEDPLRKLLTDQLRECEEMLTLDKKLEAVLRGEAPPADAGEQLSLARLCQKYKRRYSAASRFYTDAFAARPGLADGNALHRYNAACSAALAAAGRGEDSSRLDNKERARLRRQALDWLRAELALWARRAEGGEDEDRALVQRKLLYWQKDRDLAALRDPAALEELPEVERQACLKLWADVDALLRKTVGPGRPAP